jgi:hypothetical protein
VKSRIGDADGVFEGSVDRAIAVTAVPGLDLLHAALASIRKWRDAARAPGDRV